MLFSKYNREITKFDYISGEHKIVENQGHYFISKKK